MKFKLEVNDFANVQNSNPVIIDLTKYKFGKLIGDQELGKTNLINAFLMGCGMLGAPDSKENKKFINDDTGKLDLNFEFTGIDKYNYSVRCTKSSFQLTYEGENIPEPLTQIKRLLGVVGVSPMGIKDKPLKDIVKWISSYSNINLEEFQKKLDKHKANIKASQESRRDANKSVKGLTEYLNNEDLYINWEDSEKKFKKAVDVKELSVKLDVAGKASDKIIRAEEKVKQLLFNKDSILSEIDKLTAELQQKHDLLSATENNIAAGVKYVEDNKGVKREYEAIKKEYDNAAEQSVLFNKWQDIKKKKIELDEFESLAQNADAKEKKILQDVKELQAEIIPDIKGLELVLEDTHENGEMKKEGLYYEGKSVTKLSESQWWGVVLSIWRKFKVKAVVIDNYQDLGSGAVEILQKLVKDGACVLVTEMNRTKKELEIIYE